MSEPNIRIGTVGYPAKKRLVFAYVDVVELTDARGAPPKQSTARRWREEAPNRVAFTVQLPKHLFEPPSPGTPLPSNLEAYGLFQTTSENLELWEKTIGFAEGVDATSLVLLTPPEFTPAQANRKALSSFLDAVQLADHDLIWEPRGPWEHERAVDFALENGMILAVDPLQDTPPLQDSAYFRLGPFAAMGSQIGVYNLERLIEVIGPFRKVTCVFQTPRALEDARNLKKMLAEAV